MGELTKAFLRVTQTLSWQIVYHQGGIVEAVFLLRIRSGLQAWRVRQHGKFGGLINMSYAMNAMIHNTSWVTAHFHLIFGGVVVIMYFAIGYELWPRFTGRPLLTKRAACVLGYPLWQGSIVS